MLRTLRSACRANLETKSSGQVLPLSRYVVRKRIYFGYVELLGVTPFRMTVMTVQVLMTCTSAAIHNHRFA